MTARRNLTWTVAIAATLGAGAFLLHAFNPQPDPPRVFGIFGITPADTIRLNVTNIAGELGVPPGPCAAQIGFVNGDGTLLKSTNVTIQNSHSASIGMTFFEANAPGVAVSLAANVRPVVNFIPPGPCFTAISAEVVDTLTQRTRLYAIPDSRMPAAVIATNGAQ